MKHVSATLLRCCTIAIAISWSLSSCKDNTPGSTGSSGESATDKTVTAIPPGIPVADRFLTDTIMSTVLGIQASQLQKSTGAKDSNSKFVTYFWPGENKQNQKFGDYTQKLPLNSVNLFAHNLGMKGAAEATIQSRIAQGDSSSLKNSTTLVYTKVDSLGTMAAWCNKSSELCWSDGNYLFFMSIQIPADEPVRKEAAIKIANEILRK